MNSKLFIFFTFISLLSLIHSSTDCSDHAHDECNNKRKQEKQTFCWIHVTLKDGQGDCDCIKIKGELKKEQEDEFKMLFTSDTWGFNETEAKKNVEVECSSAKFYGLTLLFTFAFFALIL